MAHEGRVSEATAVRDILRGVGLQPQLSVGAPGDAFEREADAVAERVAAGLTAQHITGLPASDVTARAAKPGSAEESKRRPAQRKERKPEDERKAVRRLLQTKPTTPKQEDERVRRKPKQAEDESLRRAPKRSEDERDQVHRALRRKTASAAAEDERKRAQRKTKQPAKADELEPKPAQRMPAGPSGATPTLDETAERAVANKGAGRALEPETRARLESGLGVDLSAVRVHDDSRARGAAQALNARAFTHGSDIWLGPGESQQDTRLMAHEATHVVQQSGGGVQRAVQRDETEGAVDPTTLPTSVGQYTRGAGARAGLITFDEVGVPGFKLTGYRGDLYTARAAGAGLMYRRGYERGNPDQRSRWRRDVAKDRIIAELERKENAAHGGSYEGSSHYFKITLGSAQQAFYFGTLDEIASEMSLPTWSHGATPEFHSYDVDHIVELQLARWPDDQSANAMTNYELLDSALNQESGREIKRDIDRRVGGFIAASGGALGQSAAQIKERYDLKFMRAVPLSGPPRQLTRSQYWTVAEIGSGAQLRNVQAAGPGDIGRSGEVRLMGRERGGISKRFAWTGGAQAEPPRETETSWLGPFVIVDKLFRTDPADVGDPNFGRLNVTVPPNDPLWRRIQRPRPVDITRVPGARYAGTINKAAVRQSLTEELQVKGASPIEVDNFDIENDGIVAGGRIASDIPLLRDADIRFSLEHGEAQIYKVFTGPEIPLPPPFSLDDISLTLFASSRRGLGADGNVAFSVAGLGHGAITATASTDGPMQFGGSFDFDSRFFDPARLSFSYDVTNNRWTGAGDIGLKQNTLPGIESASGHVQYDGTTLAGSLTVVPKIRAIQQGQLDFSYSQAAGARFAGTLTLSDEIPNVRSGQLQAEITQAPGADAFSFSAIGDLASGFAGFEQQLHAEYRDGAFFVEGHGNFQRGMLSGTATVGVTNRSLDAAGQPTGAPSAGAPVIAYGAGSATLRLTPWLQATAGVRILPNGELEISGEIALPSSVEIFARRQLDKSLFNIAVQIPIVPGIVAEIGGGLSAQAGIGPGAIDQLRLGVTYNPAHEENTRVTGDAHLNIPADAGLRLAVRAGIGLGIPGASVTGGLEIGGLLGIAGAAEAGVHIDWSPATGLSIDAFGELHAEPVFRFDVSGYVSVRALGFSVYDQRWQLAALQLGSGLRFGVRFPIHYREGQPFDVSLSDVEFIVPDIDTDRLLRQLIHQIA